LATLATYYPFLGEGDGSNTVFPIGISAGI